MKAAKMLMLASSLLVALGLGSQALAAPPSWDELAPQHQEVLSTFQNDWDNLSPERREKLVRRADSWQQLPPDCREALRDRWRELRDLPPEVRASLRQRWQGMSPEQQREAMQSRPHKVRCPQNN
ncbi:MAG: DUF3106 domain-containing protein [Pseudomonadota bacterium]